MEMVAQTGKIVGTNTLNLWWGQTDMDAQTGQKNTNKHTKFVVGTDRYGCTDKAKKYEQTH